MLFDIPTQPFGEILGKSQVLGRDVQFELFPRSVARAFGLHEHLGLRLFGAVFEGIGLFRIEHMFYGENSEKPLEKLRNMILADTKEERIAALDELEPYIRESAKGTLKVLDGKPLTFRLMDPPLHEFAPQGEEKMKEAAKRLGISYEDVRKRVESLTR